jgi:DnaJ-class molecular chaperone
MKLCHACNGSGEGLYDKTICYSCAGKGELVFTDEDETEDHQEKWSREHD